MNKISLNYRSFPVAVAGIIALCILTLGMRAPDPLYAKGPKPKLRAYLEQQLKKSQEIAPERQDNVQAELPVPVEAKIVRNYLPGSPARYEGTAHAPLLVTSSRAPPLRRI